MPGQRRDPNKGMVVAREAVVVTVGAKAPTWQIAKVRDRKSDEIKDVALTEFPPLDPGSEGIPYAFKQYQRVHKDHPAVKTSPGSFMPIDDLDDAELELVTS